MRPRLARCAHTRQVARAACATWPAQPPPPARTQALAARRRYRPRMHDAPSTARLLAVARGEEAPDAVIEGAQVFCAFTREWLEGDVAIAEGRFAGVGSYEGGERIDGHAALAERRASSTRTCTSSRASSCPAELARVLLARGTTTIVCDPHELANVLGPEGVHWFLDACDGLPLEVLVVRPVVPFRRARSSRRARRSRSQDVAGILARDRVLGLAEMMNLPGRHRRGARASWRRSSWPGASGSTAMRRASAAALDAYLATGISTDHEATILGRGAGEAAARRVGAAARGLERPQPARPAAARARVRARAVRVLHRRPRARLPPARRAHRPDVPRRGRARASRPRTHCCSRRCTLRCATGCRGWARSRRAIGRTASCSTTSARSARRSCSRTGASSRETASPRPSTPRPRRSGCAKACASRRLLRTRSDSPHDGERVRVIGLIPDQILTEHLVLDAERRAGRVVADPERDLAKIAVVERHHATGRIGLGLVRGLRPAARRLRLDRRARRAQHRRGRHGRRRPRRAASSVLAEIGGGIVIYEDGELRGELPLPVAGLMSDEPAAAVVASLDDLHAVVRGARRRRSRRRS